MLAFVRSAEPRRALSRQAAAADIALAVVATVVGLVVAGIQYSPAGPSWLVVLGVMLTVAPLAARRRYPLAAFWVMLAATFATSGYTTVVTIAAVVFAGYSAVAHSRFHGLALSGVLLGAIIVTTAFSNTTPPLPGRYTALLLLSSAAAVAIGMRGWRRRADDSAERLRRALAEQEAATMRAVALERARIASELHDVVTHNVSVMVVQAGAARRVMGIAPDDAREALLAVEASGRAAMSELRHLLGLLSPAGDDTAAADAATADAELRPQPGLGGLGSLIRRVSAAGLDVDLRISGLPRDLSPGLDLAAYRVVQEGLTNVIRHAGQAATAVLLEYGTELVITVSDDGGGSSDGGEPGRGLLGLRERLALYGGELDAGPRPGGGWRLRACVPLAAAGAG